MEQRRDIAATDWTGRYEEPSTSVTLDGMNEVTTTLTQTQILTGTPSGALPYLSVTID